MPSKMDLTYDRAQALEKELAQALEKEKNSKLLSEESLRHKYEMDDLKRQLENSRDPRYKHSDNPINPRDPYNHQKKNLGTTFKNSPYHVQFQNKMENRTSSGDHTIHRGKFTNKSKYVTHKFKSKPHKTK